MRIKGWLNGLFNREKTKGTRQREETPKAPKVRRVWAVDAGEGNRFSYEGATSLKGRVRISNGTNNELIIGKNSIFSGSINITGSGNLVEIGEKCNFRGRIVVKGNNQTVRFGDHSSSVGTYILCQEGCNVIIGKWCMLSRDIEIRTTDAHSVIERTTGRRLNNPGSVEIGDHVWVGVGALISKRAKIPRDCIVAARSFVNSEIEEEGVILAGMPAKIVKRGITWHRERRPHFHAADLTHWET